MKFLLGIVLALTLTSFSIDATALDVASYRDFIKKSNANGPDSKYIRGVLIGYHQGLTEAFTQVITVNKGVINFNDSAFICIPPDIRLTPKLIEAAIDSALQLKNNREAFGDDWEKTDVGAFAYMGLWGLFPCKLP